MFTSKESKKQKGIMFNLMQMLGFHYDYVLLTCFQLELLGNGQEEMTGRK